MDLASFIQTTPKFEAKLIIKFQIYNSQECPQSETCFQIFQDDNNF